MWCGTMQSINNESNEEIQRFHLGTEGGTKWVIFQRSDDAFLHVVTLEGCSRALAEWLVEAMNELKRSEQRFAVRHAISHALDRCEEELGNQRAQHQLSIANRVLRHVQHFTTQIQSASDPAWQQVLSLLRTYFERFPKQ